MNIVPRKLRRVVFPLILSGVAAAAVAGKPAAPQQNFGFAPALFASNTNLLHAEVQKNNFDEAVKILSKAEKRYPAAAIQKQLRAEFVKTTSKLIELKSDVEATVAYKNEMKIALAPLVMALVLAETVEDWPQLGEAIADPSSAKIDAARGVYETRLGEAGLKQLSIVFDALVTYGMEGALSGNSDPNLKTVADRANAILTSAIGAIQKGITKADQAPEMAADEKMGKMALEIVTSVNGNAADGSKLFSRFVLTLLRVIHAEQPVPALQTQEENFGKAVQALSKADAKDPVASLQQTFTSQLQKITDEFAEISQKSDQDATNKYIEQALKDLTVTTEAFALASESGKWAELKTATGSFSAANTKAAFASYVDRIGDEERVPALDATFETVAKYALFIKIDPEGALGDSGREFFKLLLEGLKDPALKPAQYPKDVTDMKQTVAYEANRIAIAGNTKDGAGNKLFADFAEVIQKISSAAGSAPAIALTRGRHNIAARFICAP